MALPHKGEWQVIANYFDIIKYHHKKFTVHTPSTKHAIASQVSNVGDNNKYQTRTSFLTYFEVHCASTQRCRSPVIKTTFSRRENDVFTRKRSCETDV